MKKLLLSLALMSSQILMGCATAIVPVSSKEESANAKAFNKPSENKAGVFIFREDGPFAYDKRHFKKSLWIDSQCVATSGSNIFFYFQVEGGKAYELTTQSVFTPNTLTVVLEKGKNYFFKQTIHENFPVPTIGHTTLEQVSDKKGKAAVSRLEMGRLGDCH
jgi:hypothetical protein